MPNKHIFVGGKDDYRLVDEAIETEEPAYWHVQEKSEVGDQGFFLLPQPLGFYAFGEIVSTPVFDANSHTKYGSQIKVLIKLKPDVALKPIQTKFRFWLNIQHPTVWNHSFIIDPPSQFLQLKDSIYDEQDYDVRAKMQQLIR